MFWGYYLGVGSATSAITNEAFRDIQDRSKSISVAAAAHYALPLVRKPLGRVYSLLGPSFFAADSEAGTAFRWLASKYCIDVSRRDSGEASEGTDVRLGFGQKSKVESAGGGFKDSILGRLC